MMGVFGRFRRRTRHLPVGGSSWERTSTPSDTLLLEHGKWRHLPQVPYLLPKDVLETQRLDFQFYLIRSILHGNHASPLRSDLTSILDVGCGTGRWVIEMARTFPGAQVVGLDIELPRQSAPALPSTTSFVQANVLDGLPFADRSFDFTHQRLLVLAIPAAHWPLVVGELVRVTRPGGWVELLEGGDVFLNAGPATQRFLAWWHAASRARASTPHSWSVWVVCSLTRMCATSRCAPYKCRWASGVDTPGHCWKRTFWQASRHSSPCCVPSCLCLPRS